MKRPSRIALPSFVLPARGTLRPSRHWAYSGTYSGDPVCDGEGARAEARKRVPSYAKEKRGRSHVGACNSDNTNTCAISPPGIILSLSLLSHALLSIYFIFVSNTCDGVSASAPTPHTHTHTLSLCLSLAEHARRTPGSASRYTVAATFAPQGTTLSESKRTEDTHYSLVHCLYVLFCFALLAPLWEARTSSRTCCYTTITTYYRYLQTTLSLTDAPMSRSDLSLRCLCRPSRLFPVTRLSVKDLK